ncbi:MAG: cation transporter [Candidatus Palauibacterales bacterium]|nr:cation transporter [Candidatus Palauibacterales bacterium]MDP2528835.1 cation transporter [Candidatus Palauibacterales bacterium]
MTDVRLHIDGMKCDGCAAAVTEALEGVPGVDSAEVSLDEASARVAAGGAVAVEALVRAVESAGYGASAA